MSEFPTLFLFAECWALRTKGLAAAISGIDRAALCKEYEGLIRCAPSRSTRKDRKMRYFEDSHDGNLSGDGPSNRFEEHLAIALWALRGDWPRSGGGRTCLLDYQFPLKSENLDRGVGEIDLVGVTETGRLVVIELKVKRRDRKDDTPVKALMEGLRYAAIAYANRSAIAADKRDRFGVAVSGDPPIVQILAQKAWWRRWTDMKNSTRKAAGDWEPAFAELIDDMSGRLGIGIECLAFTAVGPDDIDYGRTRKRPRLRRVPSLYPVTGETLRIGEALPSHRNGEDP